MVVKPQPLEALHDHMLKPLACNRLVILPAWDLALWWMSSGTYGQSIAAEIS